MSSSFASFSTVGLGAALAHRALASASRRRVPAGTGTQASGARSRPTSGAEFIFQTGSASHCQRDATAGGVSAGRGTARTQRATRRHGSCARTTSEDARRVDVRAAIGAGAHTRAAGSYCHVAAGPKSAVSATHLPTARSDICKTCHRQCKKDTATSQYRTPIGISLQKISDIGRSIGALPFGLHATKVSDRDTRLQSGSL